MNSLLAEVGKKIADRWLTVLLLPGLLFTAALTCAWLLGHDHALDVSRLTSTASARIAPLNRHPAHIAVAAVAILLVATAAANAAQALAGVVNAVCTAKRPRWIVKRRYENAKRRRSEQPTPYLPARITQVGDRWRLADVRVRTHYSIDLKRIWPRLWVLVPAETRTVVQDSYAIYYSALTLTGWGLLYLAVGCWWWPAALIGLGAAATGYRRALLAAAATAELIEAIVDVNIKTLAASIDADQTRTITDADAMRIGNVLAKRQIP